MVRRKNQDKNNLIYNPSSLIISSVVKILITDCCFSALSSDQIGSFFERASAKYSISFGSGQIFFALEINDSNSEKGINLIFENTSDVASLKDSLSRFDFLII